MEIYIVQWNYTGCPIIHTETAHKLPEARSRVAELEKQAEIETGASTWTRSNPSADYRSDYYTDQVYHSYLWEKKWKDGYGFRAFEATIQRIDLIL